MKNTGKMGFMRNSAARIILGYLSIGLSIWGIISTQSTHALDPDTIAPIITISTPIDNSVVSGFPLLTGSIFDSGGIASVFVNGFSATLGSGTWTKIVYDLLEGPNQVTALATDTSGNTGSLSIQLNRISFPYNTNVLLSGNTSARITFHTDFSSTGVVLYGTGLGSLTNSMTGTIRTTSHSFVLSGLSQDTVYYFAVLGQGGEQSETMHFKTPTPLDINTIAGGVTTISSVYLSGSTQSGVVFPGNGSLTITSLTSSGSSLVFPVSTLRIVASGGIWDGVLQAPEVTSDRVNLSLSGYAFIGTFYQIGNADTELEFSGQTPTVTVRLGTPYAGKSIKIFRSDKDSLNYTELGICIITSAGDCTFLSPKLSRFAFAFSARVVPNAFSFSGMVDANLGELYVSNPVTPTEIAGQTALSITGGEYSINNGPFISDAGAISPGDSVVVRIRSSSVPMTRVSATLTIGGISGTFHVTTGTGNTPSSSGGGGGIKIDTCPDGDFSPSYYDRTCNTPLDASNTGSMSGSSSDEEFENLFITSLRIPPIIRDASEIMIQDIEGNWAESYIRNLVSRDIINNVASFRPDDRLSRAEFLKIVINTTGWDLPSENLSIPYDDVNPSAWYAPYVSLAHSKDMISGSYAQFRPDDAISRAEATKILITALGLPTEEVGALSFADLDKDSNLTQYIETARSYDILSGEIIDDVRYFRPNDPIVRAEIAKVIVNAFGL